MTNMYHKAIQLLLDRIESKTSWGKVELKELILKCLVDAGEESHEKN